MKNDILAIKNAFFYSLSGLRYLLRERAFKQELCCGIILFFIEIFRNTPLAFLLYLFSSYMLILLIEALNSGIEAAIDRISPEKHELSKKAKDIGSAAVFIAMLHFGVIWIISFFL